MTAVSASWSPVVKANGFPVGSSANTGLWGTLKQTGGNWVAGTKRDPLAWHTYNRNLSAQISQQFVVKRKADSVNKLTSSGATYAYGNFTRGTEPLDQALWSKMARKVSEHEFNLMVSIGESPQAVKTIFDTMHRVLSALKALKRGNWHEVASNLALVVGGVTKNTVLLVDPETGRKRRHRRQVQPKDLASSWLSLQYGWKPMLNDIFNAWDAIDAIQKRSRIRQVRASIRTLGTWTPSLQGENRTFTGYYSKRLYLRMTRVPSVASSLGLTNPALTVWELVPLSFVWDWFNPIEQWLEAIGFMGSITGNAAFTKKDVIHYVFDPSTLNVGSQYHKGDFGYGHFEYRSYILSRSSMNPIATLGGAGRLPPPGLNDPARIASLRHFADLSALALQVFGKNTKAPF